MAVPRGFRWPWRRREEVIRAVDDELEFHLSARAAELERDGHSAREARRRAEREFGDLAGTKHYCTATDWEGEVSMRRSERWAELRHDLSHTIRALRTRPSFTAAVVLPLALGIGATTAIFSLIWSVLLAPLPYQNPSELVAVEQFMPANPTTSIGAMSPPNYLDVRSAVAGLAGAGAYYDNEVTLTGVGAPLRVTAPAVTPSLLATLGISAALGRTFAEGEGEPGQPAVVLLSHALWVGRFGGDPNIIGRTIRLDSEPYSVIGIMPPHFAFPLTGADLWLPLGWGADVAAQRGAQYLEVIGRARPGVSLAQLETQLRTLSTRLIKDYPEQQDYLGLRIQPYTERWVGSTRKPLLLLGAAAVLVMLIAAANVTNLLLAWVGTRSTEFAVRAALGAGSRRLVRQVLTDTITLGLLGGLVGAAVATGVLVAVGRWWSDLLPRAQANDLTVGVPLLAIAISIAAGLVIGIRPARQALRGALADRLRIGKQSAGPGDLRVRRGLVAAELGLATVLLTGAVLLINAIGQLRRVDVGFRSENVVTFRTSLPSASYPTGEAVTQFYGDLLDEIAALPGLNRAGATMVLPLKGGGFGGTFTSSVPTEAGDETDRRAQMRVVTQGYFGALGIPVLAGRGFERTDRRGGAPVLVVSEGFSKRFWPTSGALGKTLRAGVRPGPDRIEGTIVGIVGDVRAAGLHADPSPTVYAVLPQVATSELTFVITTALAPNAVASSVRGLIESRDRDVLVDQVLTLPEIIGNSIGRSRFVMELLAMFAGLAVVLATVGIYGVVSYGVARRTREIGVRVALGADQSRVIRTVLVEEIKWALAGLVVGATVTTAVAPLLASAVYGIDPTAPLFQAAAPLGLLVVALIATLVPARRAARISPLVAIRTD